MHDNLTMPTVDTLKAYETLTAAKMPDEQARALVSIVQDLQEARLAEVATKQDLEILRAEQKADLSEVKSSLIRWMFGFFIGQVAVLAGLIKLLKESVPAIKTYPAPRRLPAQAPYDFPAPAPSYARQSLVPLTPPAGKRHLFYSAHKSC